MSGQAPSESNSSAKQFYDVCKSLPGCHYDFIPIHYYGSSASDLVSYAKQFQQWGTEIWLTEVSETSTRSLALHSSGRVRIAAMSSRS